MAGGYGTVMIGRLAVPFAEMEQAVRAWVVDRQVPGFRHEDLMLCDDGVTVVMAVHFDSAEQYRALADDPAQAEWFETVARPMIDGEPQWLDGDWRACITS